MTSNPDNCWHWWKKLAVVMVLLAASYAAYRFTLHQMVQARLDAVRKQGYPASLAELDVWYPQPPTNENAAIIYEDAFQHFVWTNATDKNLPIVGYAKLPPRGTQPSDAMKAGVAAYLEANSQAVELLHRAAIFPNCRFALGESGESRMTDRMHLFNRMRQGARLLSLEAFLAAAQGDSASATRAILSSVALYRALGDRAEIMNFLVQEATLWITLDDLERSLSLTAFTDAQLAELGDALEKAGASDAFLRATIGERASTQWQWDEICTGKVSVSDFSVPDGARDKSHDRLVDLIYRPARLVELDRLAQLDYYHALIEAEDAPFPERLELVQTIGKKYGAHPRLLPVTHFNASLGTKDNEIDAKFLAQLRVAEASLAVERYRLAQEGELPRSLDELAPKYLDAVPSDPFVGGQLRYKKLAKGYVVYSVGEDGKDDGGNEKKDITFTVER